MNFWLEALEVFGIPMLLIALLIGGFIGWTNLREKQARHREGESLQRRTQTLAVPPSKLAADVLPKLASANPTGRVYGSLRPATKS